MMYVSIYSTLSNGRTLHLQEGGDTVLTVSQKKFCADGDASKFENDMWQVPVTVRVEGRDVVERFLLQEKEMKFRLQGVEPKSWIKVRSSATHTPSSSPLPPPPHCDRVVCIMCTPSIHPWQSCLVSLSPLITCCQRQLMWYSWLPQISFHFPFHPAFV